MPLTLTEVSTLSGDNNLRYDAAWSVSGLTYTLYKSNINPQLIRLIFQAIEDSGAGIPDYRLLRLTPATDAALRNVAAGANALAGVTGADNTAFGNNAADAGVTGIQNTAVGSAALTSLTSGNNNTAVGHDSLFTNQTGLRNTAVGKHSLRLATGNDNTAVGNNCLDSADTANDATAVGSDALQALTTGGNNVAVGRAAAQAINTGSDCVIIGAYAGFNTTAANMLGEITANKFTGISAKGNLSAGIHITGDPNRQDVTIGGAGTVTVQTAAISGAGL